MSKWIVSYWDDDKDAYVSKVFDNHESAVKHQMKVKIKFNRHSTLKLKGAK